MQAGRVYRLIYVTTLTHASTTGYCKTDAAYIRLMHLLLNSWSVR